MNYRHFLLIVMECHEMSPLHPYTVMERHELSPLPSARYGKSLPHTCSRHWTSPPHLYAHHRTSPPHPYAHHEMSPLCTSWNVTTSSLWRLETSPPHPYLHIKDHYLIHMQSWNVTELILQESDGFFLLKLISYLNFIALCRQYISFWLQENIYVYKSVCPWREREKCQLQVILSAGQTKIMMNGRKRSYFTNVFHFKRSHACECITAIEFELFTFFLPADLSWTHYHWFVLYFSYPADSVEWLLSGRICFYLINKCFQAS